MAISEVTNTAECGPWMIGDIQVDRVVEIEWRGFPAKQLLPGLNNALLDRHHDRFQRLGYQVNADCTLTGAINTFVVRTDDLTIIVDTGCGNGRYRPNRPHYHKLNTSYLQRLLAIGVDPQQVTHVLCTHLHGDHVGWNTFYQGDQWVPTFPNAKYLIPRLDWIHWSETENREEYNEDPFYEDSIEPVWNAGLVLLIDDGHEIAPGITVENTPGHTPGHVCLNVESKGTQAVFSGDIVHSPLQIDSPELNSCFCVDPERSAKTRRSLLERWHEQHALVLPAHFPTPSAGFITDSGEGHLGFKFAEPGKP